jgi:geranylgeranyl reductase family protein
MMVDAPSSCDVLVIGAGPAGSACAQQLARAGFDVVLCDQHEFPRDKVCGDALIPDAHVAMSRLGVYQEVVAAAYRASHVTCVGHSGQRVDVPGRLAVLQRERFDDILRRAAIKAGALWLAPAKFEQPLFDAQDRVCGARLKLGPVMHNLQAKWVVLATGAVPQALMAADMCERHTPSGVALRGYVHNAAMATKITKLELVWHKALLGGYGWIFPLPGGVFNIGVGLSHSHEVKASDGKDGMADVNLRAMFERFCEAHAPARELMATGQLQGSLKGAPLRYSLRGAKLTRAGLLVAGEAAGSTYAFTGEGIGKAMETGILAAETISEARDTLLTEAQARAKYEGAIHELKPRFDLYESASSANKYPWLIDLVIRRANTNPRILKRLAEVLEEKRAPRSLLSLRGLVWLFSPFR